MDLPELQKPIDRAQSSIKTFFQPRAPSYTAPPATAANLASKHTTLSSSTSTIPSSSPITSNSVAQQANNNPLHSLPPGLPAQASISQIQPKHVQPLKRINALLLPINYPDSFYHNIIDPAAFPNFSKVILWQDAPSRADFGNDAEPKVIGGIVCRLDRDHLSRTSSIYIQSLALLSPYRTYGLATAALDAIIESLVSQPSIELPVTSLYAHVWTENTDGLEWYKARGFSQESSVLQGYYSRLKPNSAWVLRRSIGPSDHLRHSQAPNMDRTTTSSSNIPPSPLSPPPQASTSTPDLAISPPPRSTNGPGLRPGLTNSQASSFQNSGPGHEWNDLPEDILNPSSSSSSLQRLSSALLVPPGDESATSSRSSSRSRTGDKGKKKRQYPAAAFGSGNSNGSS